MVAVEVWVSGGMMKLDWLRTHYEFTQGNFERSELG